MDTILADKELSDARSFIQNTITGNLSDEIKDRLVVLYHSLTIENAKKVHINARCVVDEYYSKKDCKEKKYTFGVV